MKCKTCGDTGKYFQKNPDCANCPCKDECYDFGKGECTVPSDCPDCQPQKAESEEIDMYSIEEASEMVDILNGDPYWCTEPEVRHLEADHAQTKEALRVAENRINDYHEHLIKTDKALKVVKEALEVILIQAEADGFYMRQIAEEALAKIKEGGK